MQALDMRLVSQVLPHAQLLPAAQALAEQWIADGRARAMPAGASAADYHTCDTNVCLCDILTRRQG